MTKTSDEHPLNKMVRLDEELGLYDTGDNTMTDAPDNPAAMDDASLAVFLGFTEAEAAIAIPGLTPEKRALFERMADVVADLNMGVIPAGVIVCKPKCAAQRAKP